MYYAGKDPKEVDDNGIPLTDDSLLMILNSYHEPVGFTLPVLPSVDWWEVLLDTNTPGLKPGKKTVSNGESVEISGRSFVLLRHPK